MNQLANAPLTGDFLAPGASVRLVGHAHPLRASRVDVQMPAGLSVTEILDLALVDCRRSRLFADYIVHIDGEPVPKQWWSRVRPKVGTTVTFQPTFADTKSIIGLAIAVAALVIAGPIAGLIGLTGTALTIGTAVISAGIILGGNLALNALFPTRPPEEVKKEEVVRLPSVQGARNEADRFGAVPQLLGTHRISPRLGTKSYSELSGDNQWLRILLVWGMGPMEIDIDNLKIGETLLSEFDHEIEHRGGFADDEPISLFPSQVDEQTLSMELLSALDWITRNTLADTDEIAVDVTAPDGIYKLSDDGGLAGIEVRADMRYRKVGADIWSDVQSHVFNFATVTRRHGFRAVLPERGQYEVQVRKATNDWNNPRYSDRLMWTSLRSLKSEPPIRYNKPLCMTALRIRASDQVNGVVDTVNGIGTSLVKGFDGEVWIDNTASSNPADLFRHVLQGSGNARPVADALVDLDNLAGWWQYCDDQGFTFNQYRSDRSSAYDTLADIAAAGRAVPTFIDGKWGVIWDRPNDTIVQHFTPRNSWGFNCSRVYARLPHAWRVRFIDATNGYVQDERVVYDDGYTADTATLFEGIEFPGVTDPDLIWRHGRFHIAQSRLRPEEITISTDWEGLVCTRGDRVRLSHDVLLIGQTAGRVKSLAGQVVTLDEAVTFEADQTYGICFRTSDADAMSVTRAVQPAAPGEYTAIELAGDLSDVSAGDLFSFGVTDQETAIYRVKSILHQKNLIAQITLVDDAPGVSLADQGDIPTYVPNITLPVDPFTQPPQDLRYIEVIEGSGGSARAVARLSWRLPRSGDVTAFEVQSNDLTNDTDWRRAAVVPAPQTTTDVPILVAGNWSYRVRSLFADGTTSAWATVPPAVLLGLSEPPDDVANLRRTYVSGRSHLTWDPISNDPREPMFEIRKGASWEAALLVGDALAQPPYQTVGDDTYWIAAYVLTPFGGRVYSETKRSISITGSVLIENVVVSHDERAEGWLGQFAGTVGRDDTQNYIRTSGVGDILANDDILATPSILDAGGQGNGFYYSKWQVNAGKVSRCRVSVDYQATGVPAVADFLADPDILGNPDILQSFLTRYIRVYPIIRVAQTGPGDVFSEADVFDPVDVFATGIDWGDWIKWSPDVYVGQMFQLGLAFEILDASVGAIAYALAFTWTVDVEDRFDRYQNLTVPPGGLALVFAPEATGVPSSFIGGPNNEPLPHITTTLLDAPAGVRVVVRDITVSGCTVHVLNDAAADVGGPGVNVFAQGY